METIFALFLFISLLTVFTIDASRKRREFLQNQSRA
jgi:hypothetical protein